MCWGWGLHRNVDASVHPHHEGWQREEWLYIILYISQPVNQLISVIQLETCSHPLVDTKGIACLHPGKQLWLRLLPLHYFFYSRSRATTTTKKVSRKWRAALRQALWHQFNCNSSQLATFTLTGSVFNKRLFLSVQGGPSPWCETVQTRRGRAQLAGGLQPVTFYDHVEQRSCCCQEGSLLNVHH